MLEVIKSAWEWTGLKPVAIIDSNSFGNLLVRDEVGAYWRICPEDLKCSVVATNDDEFERLRADPDFMLDWEMSALVEAARQKHGQLTAGRSYCLKTPGVLGGEYAMDNIGTITTEELHSFAGDVALKIKDLPDGQTISFKIEP